MNFFGLFQVVYSDESENSASIEWAPICCVGGGGPLFTTQHETSGEATMRKPKGYLGGGGISQAHPSDCFGEFNEKEASLSSRCSVAVNLLVF